TCAPRPRAAVPTRCTSRTTRRSRRTWPRAWWRSSRRSAKRGTSRPHVAIAPAWTARSVQEFRPEEEWRQRAHEGQRLLGGEVFEAQLRVVGPDALELRPRLGVSRWRDRGVDQHLRTEALPERL